MQRIWTRTSKKAFGSIAESCKAQGNPLCVTFLEIHIVPSLRQKTIDTHMHTHIYYYMYYGPFSFPMKWAWTAAARHIYPRERRGRPS